MVRVSAPRLSRCLGLRTLAGLAAPPLLLLAGTGSASAHVKWFCALIWTLLVRRCAAIILAAIFVSAMFEFGKVDAIGHSGIIVVLLGIAADDVRSAVRARDAAWAPAQDGGALAIFLVLYYVGQANGPKQGLRRGNSDSEGLTELSRRHSYTTRAHEASSSTYISTTQGAG